MTKPVKRIIALSAILSFVAIVSLLVLTRTNQTSRQSPAVDTSTGREEADPEATTLNPTPVELVNEKPTASTTTKLTENTFDGNYKTYPNEYFPDFTLHYPEDWTLTTSTERIVNTNLVIRNTSIEKEGNVVTFTTQPASPAGCDSLTEQLYTPSGIEVSDNVQEFSYSLEELNYEYATKPGCLIDLHIDSNIAMNDVSGNFIDLDDDGYLDFYLNIEAELAEPNETRLNDIRSMVSKTLSK